LKSAVAYTRYVKIRILLALLAASTLSAQSKLHLRVFTSGPDGFSVNSTLVYGERDAVLIDTQFVMSEAYRVAAMILESKRNLTTVYITHGHPDHYFGIAALKQAFPKAKFVALPPTAMAIRNGRPNLDLISPPPVRSYPTSFKRARSTWKARCCKWLGMSPETGRITRMCGSRRCVR
jgi:glyoxylase-like metal-dependent hydrolase (beta-lactamase superfamily II)